MQKAFCFTTCLFFTISFLNGVLCDGDQPSEDEKDFVNFTYYSPPPPYSPPLTPLYVYESPPPPSPSPPVSPPLIYNSPPPPEPTPSPLVYPPPSSPPPPCPPPPSPTYPPWSPPPTPPSLPPVIYASPPPPSTTPPSPVVYTPPPSLVPPSPPLYTYASPPPSLPTLQPPSPTYEYSPPYSPPPSYLYASPPPPSYCPYEPPPSSCPWETDDDIDTCLLNNILKIEYMLTEFYLYSTFNHRLQASTAKSGKANLEEDNSLLIHMISDFSLLSITHISETLQLLKERALERPEIDISKSIFSKIMDKAFGHRMVPQFDAYANVTNFLIAAYTIGPSFGVPLCIDALPRLQDPNALKLVAELLSSFSIQDATITTMVFERKDDVVAPYNYRVLDFVAKIANFKKQLDTHGTHGKSHVAKDANHHTHALKKGKSENTKDMNHHVHASNDKNYHFLKRMVISDIVSLGDTRIWNNVLKIVTNLGLIQHDG